MPLLLYGVDLRGVEAAALSAFGAGIMAIVSMLTALVMWRLKSPSGARLSCLFRGLAIVASPAGLLLALFVVLLADVSLILVQTGRPSRDVHQWVSAGAMVVVLALNCWGVDRVVQWSVRRKPGMEAVVVRTFRWDTALAVTVGVTPLILGALGIFRL